MYLSTHSLSSSNGNKDMGSGSIENDAMSIRCIKDWYNHEYRIIDYN